MTKIKALVWIVGFSFVVLLLDVFRQSMTPASRPHSTSLVSTAMAAPASCPIPPMQRLAGNWVVTSSTCTSAACRATHLTVGDKFKFEQDVSGAKNFSVAVAPGVAGAARPHTEGYELRSDGIGNAVGPIVLANNSLDGPVLQIHWMIAKIRGYDADGFGSCKVRGMIEICDQQPANGSAQCTDQQHGGIIHLDPG